MKRCETSDLPGLLDFYRLVIRDTDDIAAHARWEFGKHPTEALLADYVSRGMMYITEDSAGIAAAVAVTPFQPEDYHGVEWQADLADDEVAAVHILAVNPRCQGRGYARQMMRDVIDLAKDIRYVHPLFEHRWGQRVVRFYDPDGHIIEIGEKLDAVILRFMEQGLSAEETAVRMDIPVDFVTACLNKEP